MTQFASDSFTGTADTELSAYSTSWSKPAGSTDSFLISSAGRLYKIGTAFEAVYLHSATPPSADYAVSATMHVLSKAASTGAGLLARGAYGSKTYYLARFYVGSDLARIFKCISGTYTQLASVSTTYTSGGSHSIELEVEGGAIRINIDGSSTPIVSATDSAIGEAGNAGVYAAIAPASNTTGPHLDDWSADTLAAGAPVTVEPVAGRAEARGYAPTIAQPITVPPIAGHASASGYAPSIAQPVTITPAAGHAAATGYALALTQPRTIAPTKGAAQARGYAPTIEQSAAQTVAPLSGRAEARGYAPTLSQPITITPAAGRASARGYAPEISQASSIRPETGHVQARGYAPTIAQPITLAPQAGRAQASGHAPIIVQGSPIVINPQTGSVSARGYAPGVEQGGAVTVSPAAGRAAARGYAPDIYTMPIGGYPSSVTITVPAGRLMSAASGRTITLRPR